MGNAPIPEPVELAQMYDVALLHVIVDGVCVRCRNLPGADGRCWAARIAAERLALAGWPHPHGTPGEPDVPNGKPGQA